MTNQSFAGKRTVKTFLSIVAVLLVLVTVFATNTFAGTGNANDVTIVDGAKSYTVTTTETEPIQILKLSGITTKDTDKIDITGFDAQKGGSIVIDRLNTINVEFDGNIKAYQVYADTVGEALADAGLTINAENKLNYKLDAPVEDGMIIKIMSALHVSLTADGKTSKYAVTSGTVSDLLKVAGVELGENDYTKPSASTKLKKNMKVNVYRVEYKVEKKTEKIKYSKKEIKDSSMEQGKTKTITKGINGAADVTYNVKYVNGKASGKTELTRKVSKEATQAVIKVGTKPISTDVKPNGVTSKNGYTIGQTISGKYSHYCACATCNGNSRGITTSGKRIRNGMADPHYIACNWLPLGTVINVNGTNYTVVDRGGSGLSKQGRIDIFTPGGHAECYRLGVGKCTIKIVRLGW